MDQLSRNGKVGVRGILIVRNGGSARGRYDVALGTWEETDAVLELWASSAPDNGYYEDCEFKVFFVDGNSYSGTYQLRQRDAFRKNLLPGHIRAICAETGIAWDADAFLQKYDIPKAA